MMFVQAADLPSDRKSTRLNSSHLVISYAVFCLKKKRAINDILADSGINIEPQALDTLGSLGYAIYDINPDCDEAMLLFFFFNDTATTEIYPLSLHDALPI